MNERLSERLRERERKGSDGEEDWGRGKRRKRLEERGKE